MNSGTGQHTTPFGGVSTAMPSMDYASVALYSEMSSARGDDVLDDARAGILPLALQVSPDTQRVLDTVKIALSFMAPPQLGRKQ